MANNYNIKPIPWLNNNNKNVFYWLRLINEISSNNNNTFIYISWLIYIVVAFYLSVMTGPTSQFLNGINTSYRGSLYVCY